MGNPVVHWEIAAKDGEKLQGFYTQLFDWKIDVHPEMNYGMVEAGGEGGISGGIMGTQGDMPTHLTFYVQVDDLNAYLKKAEELGGKSLVPPTPIPGRGEFALFSDLEGNTIGIFAGMS